MKTIFLALISLIFLGSVAAYAANEYTNSAHGNTTSGVDRTSTTQYAIGHCAHCHEQHASISGTEPAPNVSSTPSDAGPDKFCFLGNNFDTTATTGPYTQDDNACFYCHTNSSSYQDGGSITNNNYAATFGGDSADATGIMQAFNLASYHNLNDVLNFAKATWSSTFTEHSNPCSGCHNVHIAQRSCGKPTGSFDPTKAAISKPSDHGNLWGDDTDPNERMNNYTHLAPFYVGATTSVSSTKHEPDGGNYTKAEANGSNVPDYIAFCTDCHNSTNTIYSTQLLRDLLTIDWPNSKHGDANATGTNRGNRKAPFTTDGTTGSSEDTTTDFNVSCLDCHEPHGAGGLNLLRTEVNGVTETTVPDDADNNVVNTYGSTTHSIQVEAYGEWIFFCAACHEYDGSHGGQQGRWDLDCAGCHHHEDAQF